MARGNHTDIESSQFLDTPQYELAERGDDVGIVAFGFGYEQIPFAIGQLVVETMFILAERSEGITGEEHPVLRHVRHHRLRPMDIRRLFENQSLAPEIDSLFRRDRSDLFRYSMLGFCLHNSANEPVWSGSMWFKTR